jgi:tetratricopeptide (TPR) repeat protein
MAIRGVWVTVVTSHMFLWRFILELMILVCSGLGPGLAVLRRRRCPPLEKLCLAIGVSWILVYLAGTGIYLAHIPVVWHFAVSGAGLVLLLCSFGELKKLLANLQVRRVLLGFGLLLIWNMLILSVARHYSGGGWAGDWYEHYQRSLFFAKYLPRDMKFLDIYDLPSRPPMMNILCAHVMAQAGMQFEIFQTTSLALNLLIYFPCMLLLSALARRGRRQWMLAVVFFAASPVLVQNVTFSWTKLFCGFYVLLGTWLYLRGWQKQDSFRIVAAFMSMCAGLLVHYSAGPYLVFFSLHYAVVWRYRRRKWMEPAVTAVICTALLASWFVWSIAFYGLKTTVSSNTAVSDSQNLTLEGNLGKVGTNILYTLLPHPFHVSRHEFDRYFLQPNVLGHVRDYWFLIYQSTWPMAMGMAGGVIVIYLIIRNIAFKSRSGEWGGGPARRLRLFWGSFVVICGLLGIAVHGKAGDYGVAQICLLPMSILGITFLAANWPSLPRWLRYAAAGFVVVDFCLGVFLQMRMERLEFTVRTIGSNQIISLTSQLLGISSVLNDLVKPADGVHFWGDHFQDWSAALQILVVLIFAALLYPLALACGGAKRFSRRPPISFYVLFLLLLIGVGYCVQDEFDGSVSSAARWTEMPLEELQQDIGPARQAAEAAPESSTAQTALGEALYRTGDVRAAIDRIVTAFALDTTNPTAHYDALLLVYTGASLNDADARFFAAADNAYNYPDSASDQIALGYLLLSRHHPQAAIAPLSAAVEISPDSPDALALLGMANGEFGDADHLKRAIDLLSQALRLRPDSQQISDALRQCLRAAGGSDDQIDEFIQRVRSGS